MKRTDFGDMIRMWDMPTYPVAEAARIIGLSTMRAHRWLKGYDYQREGTDGSRVLTQRPPIVKGKACRPTHASFLDLMDLLFVKQFLDKGISLQRLRRALDETTRILRQDHFATETFFTDGRNVFLKIEEKVGNDQDYAIMQLLNGGQWVIAPIIEQLAHKIEFHKPTGYASRYYPLGEEGKIVIDPCIAFGSPILRGKGIPTATVYEMFLAERKEIGAVCSWLDLAPEEATAAVEFEEKMAA